MPEPTIAKISGAPISCPGSLETPAMTEIPIDILFDDAAEILLPRQCGKGARRAAACVCCGLAGQAMDDDGCGICDACLDAPLQATGNPDGLDFPDAFPHLSLTARHR
ncbi:hypothetical protein [Shinella zoogloeoides]|nr:hypothetical protein [Shinella zoogloeoides]UEX84192.1 hypothetical protein K8M09_22580 [Shinella zoogloeoides]